MGERTGFYRVSARYVSDRRCDELSAIDLAGAHREAVDR